MESLVQIRNLTFSYKETQVKPLDDVTFDIKRGSIFGLVGKNGAGKTTLLQVLLGALKPDTGVIEICGVRGGNILNHKIGFVPERPYYHQNFRLQEYLFYLNKMSANRRLPEEIDELIEFVHLTDFTDEYLRNFSKGMLQRTGVAQALLNRPEVLILDEPMSGLDVVGQNLMRDVILKVNQLGTTVVISSHNLYEIDRLCHDIGVLHRGKLKVVDRQVLAENQQYRLTLHPNDQSALKNLAAWLGSQFSEGDAIQLEEDILSFPAGVEATYFIVMQHLINQHIRLQKIEITGLTLEQYIIDYLRAGGEDSE